MTPSTPKQSSRTVNCVTPEQMTELVEIPKPPGTDTPARVRLSKKDTLRMPSSNQKDVFIQDPRATLMEPDPSTRSTFLEHKCSSSKVTWPCLVPPFVGTETIEVSELSLKPCPSALSYDALSDESLQDVLWGQRLSPITNGPSAVVAPILPGIVLDERDLQFLTKPRRKKPPPRIKEKPPDIDSIPLPGPVTNGPGLSVDQEEAQDPPAGEVKQISKPGCEKVPPVCTREKEELREIDIISGKGGRANNHKGNKDLWVVVLKYRPAYKSLPPHKLVEKNHIATVIFNLMLDEGRRFLSIKKDSEVVEMTKKRSLEKIKQALRDKYVPLFAAG
eukprot:Nitzschia sp. Nitz4//scaffold16_size188269//143130//144128//NITZ4_001811-RA/size188269-processed-gene-0.65-mRNA-1//-1//CDS//3329538577//4617//frame0